MKYYSERDMIQTVFERKEIKYIITGAQRRALLEDMRGRMQPDKFGLTTICNIYFDTPNNRLVRESIEKPLYKEKLRLRTYGVPDDGSNAFLELKKKFEGIVYKRREILPYKEAHDFLVGRRRPENMTQILKEIDWTLDFYHGLAPAMGLFYDRIAYFGCEDEQLRMTLDNNLRSRLTDLDLRSGAHGDSFLDEDLSVMEIKISDAMPLWMAEILDKHGIYPGSISKYGTSYTKNFLEGCYSHDQ